MKNKTVHTFAVIAYGESPYLEECIYSLKKQTVKSDIYISTSTPSAFLNRVSEEHRIPLALNSNPGGIASDWSFAYNRCSTKYVTLAHQDDIYTPAYTEYCLSAAKRQGDSQLILFTDYSDLRGDKIIHCNLNLLIKRLLLMPFLFKESVYSRFMKKSILMLGNPISCPSVMYNKSQIGPFGFSDEFVCNMDWDAWHRLSRKRGSFIRIKKRLVLHRIHPDSQTSLQIKAARRKKEDRLIFLRLWPRPIADMLANVYSIGLSTNKIRLKKSIDIDEEIALEETIECPL